ncbi:uncharacterized protein [Euwallacea similis]|uniref:uncharacterized protein n=1 Tax=Euwallacea similis TaxID=1736056 RepID=UPI00344B6E82
MKGIVPLSLILSLCIGLARSEAGSKDEQPKQPFSNANAIGSTMKPDLLSFQQFYGNKVQTQQVLFPDNFQSRTQLQQALPYNHQPEPPKKHYGIRQSPAPVAMVIIAQPAYIPASMLQQGNIAQQLLQYFQGMGSSGSKYQFVPANHQPFYQPALQPQTIAQYVDYPPKPSPTQYPTTTPAPSTTQQQPLQAHFYAHEALPAPQALISAPLQNTPETRSLGYEQQVDIQPQELQEVEAEPQSPDFEKLAQQAAQHFVLNGGLNSGSRTAPAIITGLEHFSPEQQEKIKAQLSDHFGSPLKPLEFNAQQQEGQQAGGRKHYHEFRQRIRTDKFVPSLQVKDGEITQTNAKM